MSVLADLRQRPVLYFGEKTISGLYHFLNGCTFACNEHQVRTNLFTLPSDIGGWIAYRLRYKAPNPAWHKMILERVPEEAGAFDFFFDLLDQHSKRVPCLRAKLRGIQRTYSETNNGVCRTMNYPNTLSLITYTDDPGLFVYSDDPGNDFPRQPFFPSLDGLLSWLEVDKSVLDAVDMAWAGKQ